ncbi:hypothetical protein BC832DRAFT_551776 [Gaertneriomyces semiglobifer]|nr:hypothetical protein BC832DRAFT_551776 [Gaertneriomyces semiglobifer]
MYSEVNDPRAGMHSIDLDEHSISNTRTGTFENPSWKHNGSLSSRGLVGNYGHRADSLLPDLSPPGPPPPNTRRILSLLLALNLCTFLLTLVPVVVELPGIRPPWYVGNDVLRLLEPIIALPLYLAILIESRVFAGELSRHTYIVLTLFAISAALYQQGAGFHSASNMFKHPFRDFMDSHPDLVDEYPFFSEFLLWVRNTWQKDISHYMYAAGGTFMAMTFAYVYRDVTDTTAFENRTEKLIWSLSSIIYGLIIGSVAIEFPKGPIVASLLVVLYGLGTLGSFLCVTERSRAYKLGRRYIVQSYVASYLIALVIIVGWLIYAGGFFNREEAGIKF